MSRRFEPEIEYVFSPKIECVSYVRSDYRSTHPVSRGDSFLIQSVRSLTGDDGGAAEQWQECGLRTTVLPHADPPEFAEPPILGADCVIKTFVNEARIKIPRRPIADNFSRPGRAVGLACVCLFPKLLAMPFIWIFGMQIHLYAVEV